MSPGSQKPSDDKKPSEPPAGVAAPKTASRGRPRGGSGKNKGAASQAPASPRTNETGKWRAIGERATTEAMLESAALELVEEHGILAGLNLREVADRIGVNRGLVYHYFGSRRDLLRSALRRRGGQLASRLAGQRAGRPFIERLLDDFSEVVATSEAYRLITLLVLDGDPRVKTVPLREQSLGLLRADVERGDLPEDMDLEALWTILVSMMSAYSLFRERFAKEFAIPLAELDERVAKVLERIARRTSISDGS